MKKEKILALKIIGFQLVTILVYFMMFLVQNVFAQWSYECQNNETLQRQYNYSFQHGTAINNLTVTKQENCQFGCDNVTHSCKPNPTEVSAMYLGSIFIMLIGMGLVIKLLKRWF